MTETGLLALTSTAAWLVGLSKGGLPTIGMLSVPLLSLTMSPIRAAILLLPIYLLTDVVGVWLYRREFSARNLKILIPAGLLGVLLGWALAARVPDRGVAFMLGAMGIGYCLHVWFGGRSNMPAKDATLGRGVFWGTLAGFTSFIAHAGGPPFQIYVLPQRLPKLVFAGTTTITFAVINAAKIVPYMQLRPYGTEDLKVAAALIPAALIGTAMGAWATRRMPEAWFYRLVRLGLFAMSVKLLSDAVR